MQTSAPASSSLSASSARERRWSPRSTSASGRGGWRSSEAAAGFRAGCSASVRARLEEFQVDVGFEITIEEYDAVAPAAARRGTKLVRLVNWAPNLMATGTTTDRPDRGDQFDIARFDDVDLSDWVSRYEVNVELDGVGAGVLKEFGVVRPAAGRTAVEARNDGYETRSPGLPQLLQVLARPNLIVVHRE